MHKTAILLALASQLGYLAWMAADRELLLHSGDSIHLRTAPVDPRDLFRGDYVTLRYDVSAISGDAFRGDANALAAEPDSPVYTSLEPVPGSADLFRLAHASTTPPPEGPFLAGRTVSDWRFPRPPGGIAVRYGIEKLFVEQGRGLELEDRQGSREGLQVPMEVELAVAADGRAAIRGYRFSALGIQLEVSRPAPNVPRAVGARAAPETAETPLSPEVTVTLRNVGDEPLWLIDPGDHCSFRLLPAEWGAEPWPSAHSGCEGLRPGPADLRRLEPEEAYRVVLDLDLPRWHLRPDGGTTTTAGLLGRDGEARFRIAYGPDPRWATELEMPEGRLWIAELPSAAFTAAGQVD